MTSQALRSKIQKTRAVAPSELPKARLCAAVVLAALEGEPAVIGAIAKLKEGLGANWSAKTALQFMSGRRGQFAAECAPSEEMPQMKMAHLVAKQICSNEGLGAVAPLTALEAIEFAKLVAAAKVQF